MDLIYTRSSHVCIHNLQIIIHNRKYYSPTSLRSSRAKIRRQRAPRNLKLNFTRETELHGWKRFSPSFRLTFSRRIDLRASIYGYTSPRWFLQRSERASSSTEIRFDRSHRVYVSSRLYTQFANNHLQSQILFSNEFALFARKNRGMHAAFLNPNALESRAPCNLEINFLGKRSCMEKNFSPTFRLTFLRRIDLRTSIFGWTTFTASRHISLLSTRRSGGGFKFI